MNRFATGSVLSSLEFTITYKEINAMKKQSCDGKTTDGSLLMFEETDRDLNPNTCLVDRD